MDRRSAVDARSFGAPPRYARYITHTLHKVSLRQNSIFLQTGPYMGHICYIFYWVAAL